MSQRAAAEVRRQARSPADGTSGVLQRKCDKCCKKKPTLQRKAVSSTSEAMPAVPEDQISPAAVGAVAHAFMEPCFFHDFSRIPVHSRPQTGIQAKLIVNAPGDVYEQEADRVADQVLAAPVHHAASGVPQHIQRFSAQPAGQMEAPASVDRALASSGRPLEPALRQDMEQRFGHDFSRVRVHTNATAAESSRAISALAYTVGSDTFFGSGQYAPHTEQGKRLLAHELTHVVQQGAATSTHKIREIVTYSMPFGTVQLYADCTSDITGVENADSQIDDARSEALTVIAGRISAAIRRLAPGGGSPAERAAQNRAFNNPDDTQVGRIQEVYDFIARWLPGADFICDSERIRNCRRNDEPTATYAFVRGCPPSGRVHLCPVFFENPSVYQKGMYLIHEGAHRAGVCPTGSEFYFHNGGTPPPDSANICADSYSSFDGFLMSEQQRALEESVGGERPIPGRSY